MNKDSLTRRVSAGEIVKPWLILGPFYHDLSAYVEGLTLDQGIVESRVRQGILRGTARHASFCVYRTPDYMVSGLQDHRKGEYESSTHVALVTLCDKVVIFWSCPHTSGEGSGLRPDYWSGHTTLPRVIQYRNVMSLTWRLSRFATYESPSIGAFITGWDIAPTVNGQPIKLHGYPMVDSPWAFSRFGSGELTVCYGDEAYDIWFNQ